MYYSEFKPVIQEKGIKIISNERNACAKEPSHIFLFALQPLHKLSPSAETIHKTSFSAAAVVFQYALKQHR